MEISAVTSYGWRGDYQTVERRITYDYSNGNDVTIVEHRSYQVTLYDSQGTLNTSSNKGTNIDQMA